MIPLYKGGPVSPALIRAGMVAYDALSFDKNQGARSDKRMPWHRFVGAREALELEREIRAKVKALTNVVTTAAIDRPELRVVPKLAEAAELGVSVADIAQTVRIASIGDISQNLAKFSAGDRQVPIRVQLDESARADLSTFETLKVRTASGQKLTAAEFLQARALGVGERLESEAPAIRTAAE